MLRPLAPPTNRTPATRTGAVTARRASVQLAAEGITSALYSKRGNVQRGSDAKFQSQYQDWQGWARRYARTISAAAFQALVVSDLCARCVLGIEIRDQVGAEWNMGNDPSMASLMDEYANPLQTANDLVRLHTWHYQVAGEMLQTQRDGDGAVEYGIYSVQAAEWDKPDDGQATIKLAPDGKVVEPGKVSDRDTAFELPRNQVVRFWLPDQEWQAYATSPMAAVIDDLHRYRALSKYALKVADAAIAMVGLMWFPGEAFTETVGQAEDDLAEASADAGIPKYALEELYYEVARIRHSDSDDIMSVVPPLFHWDKDAGPPEHVNTGPGLDPSGIDHRKEALEDFARGTNLPVTTVLGGGVGDANHWSEWLASRQVFASAVAPTMDRATHMDLTRSFLWPRARISGVDPANLRLIRVGYDSDPVIVKEDNSVNALAMARLGAINFKAARDATGFDDEDAMTDPTEREWLMQVLANGHAGSTGGVPKEPDQPVDASTVVQAPPNDAVSPLGVTAAATEPPPFDSTQAEVGRRALRRLTSLRKQLGTKLLADARLVYDDALRQAGARVVNTARNGRRAGTQKQQQIAQAVAAGEPIRALLATVGVKEDDLLRHTLDVFKQHATAEMAVYQQRVAEVFDAVGITGAALPTAQLAASAVDYLATGLQAMVRARLLDGVQAAIQAAGVGVVPRRRFPPAEGFDLPGLPDPDELSRAAARLVRNALDIHEGRKDWQFPATPDHMPHVVAVDDRPQVEEQLSVALDIQPIWTWAHGFYGEPGTVLDGHDRLDGFTTNDPSSAENPGDPDLGNDEPWPASAYYFPADHDGCTCEWVIDDGAGAGDPEQIDVPFTVPRIQSTRAVLDAARARTDGATDG